MKLRPCRPRSFHGTSDDGLPDRSGAVGWTAPCSVPSSLTLKAEFIASTRPWKSTPLSRKTTSAVTTTTPSGRAMPVRQDPAEQADQRAGEPPDAPADADEEGEHRHREQDDPDATRSPPAASCP